MTVKEKELVLWFEDVRNVDVSIVGGKNASLGEMINSGLPVPPGFAVTAFSYERFIQEKKIAEQIYSIIKETVTNQTTPNITILLQRKSVNSSKKLPCPKTSKSRLEKLTKS